MDRKENAPDTYKTVDLVATYEDLFNIPHDQKVTHYFGDYGGHYFNYGISQEQKNVAYEKRVRMEMKKKAELAFDAMEAELISAMKQDPVLSAELHSILSRAREKVSADEN